MMYEIVLYGYPIAIEFLILGAVLTLGLAITAGCRLTSRKRDVI